eukprot:3139521-Alexandrium_andersonii.AAC.1
MPAIPGFGWTDSLLAPTDPPWAVRGRDWSLKARQWCSPVTYHLPSKYFVKYDLISTAASPRCLSGHGCTWRGA